MDVGGSGDSCCPVNGFGKASTILQNGFKDFTKQSDKHHVFGNGTLNSTTKEDTDPTKSSQYKNGYLKSKTSLTSSKDEPKTVFKESFEPPTLFTATLVQISFYILMLIGYLSQLLSPPKLVKEKGRSGYPPLYDRFSAFYSRYVYRRIRDCWNYPICSVPGSQVVLKDRITQDSGWTFEFIVDTGTSFESNVWRVYEHEDFKKITAKVGPELFGTIFRFTGGQTKCINLASYNYLGFAESSGPCAEAAIKSIYEYGISTGSTRKQYGTCALHDELEQLMAEFLGVEDAITFGMGYATNSLNIPTLIEPGCLVISDEKNHSSLIWGIKLNKATTKVMRHNDVQHLEEILREAIYYGQPNQPNGEYKPWKKIVIFVEGVYSMEGSICRLPQIIALKKKYKAYLYLDEAHSIGAMGKHGRGIVEYFGCDSKDIDVLMGTFTKSFGSAGGYIAGSKELITFLREESCGSTHAWAMSPGLAAQISTVLKILMKKDGTDEGQKRLETLAKNTRYFRMRLEQMGIIIHGNDDSPVVPMLVYWYSKIVATVRNLIKHKIATVGVGYPATPLYEGRLRFCLSAGHTKEQLDYALDTIGQMADEFGFRYSRKPRDLAPIDYDNIKTYHDK